MDKTYTILPVFKRLNSVVHFSKVCTFVLIGLLLLGAVSHSSFAQGLGQGIYVPNLPFGQPLTITAIKTDPAGNSYMYVFGPNDFSGSPDVRYPVGTHLVSYDAQGRFRWRFILARV